MERISHADTETQRSLEQEIKRSGVVLFKKSLCVWVSL